MDDIHVLWIDDELVTTLRYLLKDLQRRGFRFQQALSIAECVKILEDYKKSGTRPDVVLLDAIMPYDEEGIKALSSLGVRMESDTGERLLDNARRVGLFLLRAISVVLPDVPVLVFSNLSENTEIGAAVMTEFRSNRQVKAVLPKPQRAEDVAEAIHSAIEPRRGS